MYSSDSASKSDEHSDIRSESSTATSPTIVIDGREFKLCRHFFPSSKAAGKAGYFPKTYWAKQGREVVEVHQPALVVVMSWRTYSPADDDVYLGLTLNNEYLVSAPRYFADLKSWGCWEVFLETQTVPKQTVNKSKSGSLKGQQKKSTKRTRKRTKQDTSVIPASSTTTSSSPPTTSPYDVGNIANSDAKYRPHNDLGSRANETRLIRKPRAGKTFKVFFPEGFDWDKYPQLAPYRSSVMWLAHKLHERRFLNAEAVEYGRDAYISIKAEYARAIDPKFTTVVQLLLKLGILERLPFERGVTSFRYRFADPKLRKAARRYVPLDDPKLVARINRHRQQEMSTRTDRWLYSQLFQLALTEIDDTFLTEVADASRHESGGNVENKLEAYRYWLDRIGRQDHFLSPDDQGRRYSIPTIMKRELRSLLRVDGNPLHQIDIKNSQWTFLALEMRRKGIECRDYFAACEQGLLYETVAKAAKSKATRGTVTKAERDKAKKLLTQRALFSGNDAPCQRTKIKRTFDRLFPEVAQFLFKAKATDKGGSKLAKMLQAAEADLIIDKVCGRLRREGRVKFVTPVHDCLIFLPEDGDYVMAVMEDEFAKLGVRPRLEINDLRAAGRGCADNQGR